jgi:hypothetical protein
MANRFDIHIQTLPEAEQRDTFKFMSFGFDASIGVKGFQQLINIWLKCFLTPKGSDPTDTTYGTPFANLIASNLPIQDARDVVVLSVDDCNEQVFAFQKTDATLTATERLAEAKLINYVEDRSAPGLTATIEIKNQAGQLLRFNLPVYAP